jgi:regulator of protease activity HflC (stomatin/prohibitin superfamily)
MTPFAWIGQLADLLGSFIWPYQKVEPWERGIYTHGGRHVTRRKWWMLPSSAPDEDGSIGPGWYFVFPWFGDIITRDVQPGVMVSPMQDVTLRGGDVLTFSASAGFSIESVSRAILSVENYRETMVEYLMGIAEALADTDPTRFDAARGKRDRLRKELAEGLDEKTRQFGVRVHWVQFPHFVTHKRVYRLLSDKSIQPAS